METRNPPVHDHVPREELHRNTVEGEEEANEAHFCGKRLPRNGEASRGAEHHNQLESVFRVVHLLHCDDNLMIRNYILCENSRKKEGNPKNYIYENNIKK
jgi:hypothetical protein